MSSGPKEVGEVDLLLRGQRLAAPDEHGVLVHRGVDGRTSVGASGLVRSMPLASAAKTG